jgi:hypothetical protein
VIRSTDSRAADDDQQGQPAKAKDEKKKKGKGKKNGKKGDKAQKKKDNKKGNKKNGKPAEGAPETPAATGNNRKRTCTCRLSLAIHHKNSLLTFEPGSSRNFA